LPMCVHQLKGRKIQDGRAMIAGRKGASLDEDT
jgi:hypothetical protein